VATDHCEVVRGGVWGRARVRHRALPLRWQFILNKATSLAAVVFVACSYLIGKVIRWHDHDHALRLVVIKFCGLVGFFLAAVHTLFSLTLLSPAYYAKYFDDSGRFNLQGEVALAVGVIALFFLLSPAVTTLPMMPKALGGWRWKRSQRAGYVALVLVVVHLVILGWKGWLAPKGWHGGLPPISLVAVVVAMVPLLVKRKLVRDKQGSNERTQ
jgi:DMSO/TMAO reductase YedYZ heme-binding membrane subunit